MLHESPAAPAENRRSRLKKFAKILPGDRVSVEEHYPRFYQKCQWLKSRNTFNQKQSVQGDDVTDGRPAVPAREQKENCDPALSMAHHFEDMTLQRGCWLQATLRGHNRSSRLPDAPATSAPAIVFIHKKQQAPEGTRSRAELAVEVLQEFTRQKRILTESTSAPVTPARKTPPTPPPRYTKALIRPLSFESRRVS